MECAICYTKEATYKIQCKSTIPHMICNSCEQEWRMKSLPTRTGRVMKCPFCRKEENYFEDPSNWSRTSLSYEMELKKVYEELHQAKNATASARFPSVTRLSSSQVARFMQYAREDNDFALYARARLLLSGIASPPSSSPTIISSTTPVSRIIPVPSSVGTTHTPLPTSTSSRSTSNGTTETSSRGIATVSHPTRTLSNTDGLKVWCQSGRRELNTCTTKGKTSRICSYTCQRKVCRSCRTCPDHSR